VKKSISDFFAARKAEVAYWTDRTQAEFGAPQLSESPVVFAVAEKTQAISHGGAALIHQIAVQSKLIDRLNEAPILKSHMPYFESDHILNLAYNFLCGGTALEHIEYRRLCHQRNNKTRRTSTCSGRIPHSLFTGRYQRPTGAGWWQRAVAQPGCNALALPAGDFCRRFSPEQIEQLQDKINDARWNVWSRQPKAFFDEAVVDMDGTIAPTFGECKQGMGMSDKGEWGYHPLIVSPANTNEVLYVKNRSGNRPSHEGAHQYIDKSITLLRRAGFKIVLELDWCFSAPAGRYLIGIVSPNRFGYVPERFVFAATRTSRKRNILIVGMIKMCCLCSASTR
jgi:hypothetical protein